MRIFEKKKLDNIIFKNPQITILLEEESINYIELLLKDIINKN